MDESEYLDLSSNNHLAPDSLAQLWAAGCRRLMLKATEGVGYYWDAMPALAREWHSFGPAARVGYYHWLYGTLSGGAQAAYFWMHIESAFRDGDWLMTDFEDIAPARAVPDLVLAGVLADFNAAAGQHAALETYTGDWFLDNRPTCVWYLMHRPVVLSDYDHSPPANRHGLRLVVAHQHTDRAIVPGFPDPVDLNRRLDILSPSGGGTPIPEGDDVKPWFIKASSGRRGIWFMVPGVRLKEVDAAGAAVLAAVHGIPNVCTDSKAQGELVAVSNLLASWGN